MFVKLTKPESQLPDVLTTALHVSSVEMCVSHESLLVEWTNAAVSHDAKKTMSARKNDEDMGIDQVETGGLRGVDMGSYIESTL